MNISGIIGPATLDTIQRAKSQAEKDKCKSILALVNTPGGSLQSTRIIVQEIINSPIPFLCLVYPSGGHAGSAGAIILQACHVSGAMAATNIGAATPISGSEKDIQDDLRKKILNDTISWLEGITKLRGRNIKFSEEIITQAKAVSATEAYKLKAIDFLAKTKKEFLELSKGKEVALSNDKTVKIVVGELMFFDGGLREKILSLVADPQTAYMMFMGSLALIYFEVTHPGMIVPGVVGGIGLVISLISLHKLDVTWGGFLLILLGVGLMILEAFVPSFGFLGIGGMASFLLGSLFLFDETKTGYSLPVYIAISTSILVGLIMFGIAYLAFSTRRVKKIGGKDSICGDEVEVNKLVGPKGKEKLLYKGELWKFKSAQHLAVGDKIKIVNVKGLTLIIEKI